MTEFRRVLFRSLHRHSKDRLRHRGDSDVGEWISVPAVPVVFLRRPSVSFAGGENVNKRPVKEDRHFVRLNKGRMVVRSDGVGWDSRDCDGMARLRRRRRGVGWQIRA